jgi:hypothetical protein
MSRPKGFTPDWRPQAKTRVLLAQIEAVLDEYRSYLPLTVRQVFYRLVGAHSYPKTEKAYNNLSNTMVMARRAGIIPFRAIRDDGIAAEEAWGYRSEAQFWRMKLSGAQSFTFLRQAEQPGYVEVWVEAAGAVPLVRRAVADYGVPIYSCGGFDSLTFKYDAAVRMSHREVPTIVLHIGDNDPRGVALFQAVAEDVEAMAADLDGDVEFMRIAVTPEQITRYQLSTAPAQATDKRGAWKGGDTVQVEAFPPDVLVGEVREAVEAELDMDVYRDLRDREARAQDRIAAKLRELREHLTADEED